MLMQKFQLTKTINVFAYKITNVCVQISIGKNFCTDLTFMWKPKYGVDSMMFPDERT